jgi:mono/diheme cytochrome c family protein
MRKPFLILLAATMPLLATGVQAADYVAMSGQDLYSRFCASCHGISGRGDGPVAKSIRVEVPDLTLVTRRAGGKYPRERIVQIIDGRHILGAHGTRTMPVWGEDLSRLEIGNPDAERASRVVIEKLADYLGVLQKPTSD